MVNRRTDNNMTKWKRTNSDLQKTTQKKIEQQKPRLKAEMNSGVVEGWAVPAPLVASVVMLLFLQITHYFMFSLKRITFGYGYYAIAFGVQQLSGSLYLNMFLLSIVEIPAQMLTYFLNNWYVWHLKSNIV